MLHDVYFEFLERAESCEAGSHRRKKKNENCSLDTLQQSSRCFRELTHRCKVVPVAVTLSERRSAESKRPHLTPVSELWGKERKYVSAVKQNKTEQDFHVRLAEQHFQECGEPQAFFF